MATQLTIEEIKQIERNAVDAAKESPNQHQLMLKRWKIIADFPKNKYYPVGKIITDYGESVRNENNVKVEECDFHAYPHLFRKLEWWEERANEDLPQYVKKLDGEIRKIKQHFCNSSGEPNQFGCQLVIDEKIEKEVWNYFSYRNLTPATETEYNNYLNSKP